VWPLFPRAPWVSPGPGLSGTSKTTRSIGLPALGDHCLPARPMIAAQIRNSPGVALRLKPHEKRAAQTLGGARRRDRRW
jgi:hypothetical protein